MEGKEKYKQMWEEFQWKYGEIPIGEYIDIATQMNNIKQKYFSPMGKVVVIEIEAGKEEDVEGGLENIKEFVDLSQIPKMKIIDIRRTKCQTT